MAATWNPADKAANITLSNTNHTATGTAVGNSGVRASTHHGSNKWYLEYSAISFGGAGQGALGFAYASQSLTSNSVVGLFVNPGGTVFNDAGLSFNIGATVEGHVFSMAVDLNADRAWVRVDNGAWLGAGGSFGAGVDPVAGTGGIDISARGANDYYPFTFLQNNGGPTVTVNEGDSAFSETQPSGFTAWDSTPPPLRFSSTVIA